MAVKIANLNEGQRYLKHMESWANYLVAQVKPNGFISASAAYYPYTPHWIRDASFISIGLLDYASFAKARGMSYEDARNAAHRINRFHCEAIERHMGSINKALDLALEDPEFFKLKNHIPARVGQDGDYYRDHMMDDNYQKEVRSGLIQHDTIPLAIHALYKEHRAFGLDESQKEFLNKNMRTLLNYLGKIYFTECANMWEMETTVIHSYDVGVIHSAFQIAKALSDEGIIDIGRSEIEGIETGLFDGGPKEFLKRFFIDNGVIYREKWMFQNNPDKLKSVDIAELYLFTMFGINDRTLGIDGVESSTIKEIDKVLFASNALPIRHLGDEYFSGGRWINVGAEFSIYLARKGETQRAKRIIDYVVDKYGEHLPEQEIVDPASPQVVDYYYVNNGYKVIDDLAWSYAAMLSATSVLLESMEKHADKAVLRG